MTARIRVLKPLDLAERARVVPFVSCLYWIVQCCEDEGSGAFTDDGFEIYRPLETWPIVEAAFPYSTSLYNTFTRQLNFYGFRLANTNFPGHRMHIWSQPDCTARYTHVEGKFNRNATIEGLASMKAKAPPRLQRGHHPEECKRLGRDSTCARCAALAAGMPRGPASHKRAFLAAESLLNVAIKAGITGETASVTSGPGSTTRREFDEFSDTAWQEEPGGSNSVGPSSSASTVTASTASSRPSAYSSSGPVLSLASLANLLTVPGSKRPRAKHPGTRGIATVAKRARTANGSVYEEDGSDEFQHVAAISKPAPPGLNPRSTRRNGGMPSVLDDDEKCADILASLGGESWANESTWPVASILHSTYYDSVAQRQSTSLPQSSSTASWPIASVRDNTYYDTVLQRYRDKHTVVSRSIP